MPALFVELDLALKDVAIGHLIQRGFAPDEYYANISGFNLPGFQNHDIWSFWAPAGTKLRPLLEIPGILYVEPNEEHNWARGLRWRDEEPFGTKFMALPPVETGPEVAMRSALPEMLAMCRFPAAWEISRGAGAIIAIDDSGINAWRLPDSAKAGGWATDGSDPWLDSFGHGTMVALITHAAAPDALIFSAKLSVGPNGGMTKKSVVSVVDFLIPIIQDNPATQFVLNSSWASDCGKQPYH